MDSIAFGDPKRNFWTSRRPSVTSFSFWALQIARTFNFVRGVFRMQNFVVGPDDDPSSRPRTTSYHCKGFGFEDGVNLTSYHPARAPSYNTTSIGIYAYRCFVQPNTRRTFYQLRPSFPTSRTTCFRVVAPIAASGVPAAMAVRFDRWERYYSY